MPIGITRRNPNFLTAVPETASAFAKPTPGQAQPKTNCAFWRKKIARNRERDRRVNYALRKRGWVVVRVWEHALTRKEEARTVRRLKSYL